MQAEALAERVRADLDRAARAGVGAVFPQGRMDWEGESLKVMDGRLGGASAHLFMRGRGRDSTRLRGKTVLGTPLPWETQVRGA